MVALNAKQEKNDPIRMGQLPGPRACLFTLIVVISPNQKEGYLRQVVEAVSRRFPCRIIVVASGKSLPESMHLSVESVNREELVLAPDQITIETAEEDLDRASFLMLPHLVPDLPVYLLWGRDPAKHEEALHKLEKISHRFVFDSATACDLTAAFGEMLERTRQGQDLVDINWARLSGWRHGCSELFDTPEKIQQLEESETVRITYNGLSGPCSPHPEIQAIYFQGWLASRSDWQFQGLVHIDGKIVIQYTAATVELVPKSYDDLLPGQIIELDIRTKGDCHFSMTRQASTRNVHVQCTTPKRCEIPYLIKLSNLSRNASLLQELFFLPPSEHYRKTLKALSVPDWSACLKKT